MPKLQQVQAALNERDLERALVLINAFLNENPQHLDAQTTKASICYQLNQHATAKTILLDITQNHPTYVPAHIHIGHLYRILGAYTQAKIALLTAINLDPQNVDAQLYLGLVYHALEERDKAKHYYEICLTLNPNNAQAHYNKGRALQDDFDFAPAFASYKHALAINPHYYAAHANLVMAQHYAVPYDAVAARDEALAFGATMAQQVTSFTDWLCAKEPNRPLRVGLVSADLRFHPVGWFLRDVLLNIDSNAIHLFAYANDLTDDALSQAIRPQFEQWRDITQMNDATVSAQIRADQIDILVDLSGHTAGNRLMVFAHKPAPIQVTWLGYFASTGLTTMDYIIGDPISLPVQDEHLYCEKPWRLPHSRLFLFKPDPVISSPLPSLTQPFTFGCFQELAKINDEVLKVWAQIFKQTPHAKLRLQTPRFNHAFEQKRFTHRLIQHGFDPAQVELVGSMPLDEYLKAYSQVDILLDTFPFPGGTTTVQALWLGVPTLTLSNAGLLGRQGEALLKNVGLAHWVCETTEEYIQRACICASPNPQVCSMLAQLREQLPQMCAASPAADARGFADDLTTAWQQMWARYCA